MVIMIRLAHIEGGAVMRKRLSRDRVSMRKCGCDTRRMMKCDAYHEVNQA